MYEILWINFPLPECNKILNLKEGTFSLHLNSKQLFHLDFELLCPMTERIRLVEADPFNSESVSHSLE